MLLKDMNTIFIVLEGYQCQLQMFKCLYSGFIQQQQKLLVASYSNYSNLILIFVLFASRTNLIVKMITLGLWEAEHNDQVMLQSNL